MTDLISIFTPVYNRSHTLFRLYQSLQCQTYMNFEWIIVDDGSTDNFDIIVEDIIKKASFNVFVEKFPTNKGKHNAHNKALELANGYWFTIVDSDDALDKDALLIFKKKWNTLSKESQFSLQGIYANCKNEMNQRFSPIIDKDFVTDDAEMFFKYQMYGDRWCIRKTEIYREFMFPNSFIGSHFPEGIIWRKIGTKYKVLLINDPIYIIYLEDENSISRRKKKLNEISHYLSEENIDILNNYLVKYFRELPSFFIKRFLIFDVYSFFYINKFSLWKRLKPLPLFISFLFLPLSIFPAAYLYFKNR